jgi:hypothetical protein
LDEGGDAWGVQSLLRVSVSPLSRVAKEGCIAHIMSFLPVPITKIPLEVGNEASFQDPEDWGFFTWNLELFGNLECCPVVLLG